MSTHGNEPFLFELNEQITFRQGEEIDDLYGISIQPDVNIIKESSYIQLRGVLMVSGDYQSLPREEPMLYMDDQEDEENYVQQVKALDNGFTTFQYPIPVDITLPSSRVNETGEPDVEVEYFDYELPEPNSLHVYAKIRLLNVEMSEVEEEVRSEELETDFELKEIPSFDEEDDGEFSDENESDLKNEQEEEEEAKGREFWNKKQSQTFNEFFNKQETKSAEQEMTQEKPMEYEEDDEKDYEKEYEEDSMKPEAEYEEEGSEEGSASKKKIWGLGYLSQFFRDENEPDKVRLKMRFVQENETLDSIADAYKVPVSKLERLNGLESENELKAGDVLYVPYEKQNN